MNVSADATKRLRSLIDRIEAAYEYMLAYAAQGRRGDEQGSEIRTYLEGLRESLAALADACANPAGLDPELDAPFIALLQRDRENALSVVQLVLSRRNISSQLVDNLNASLHLRTLLTDLFLLDERIASE
jgi:hypothetical protein